MKSPRNGQGVTLLETMIAVLVAVIGVFGLGGLIFQATVTNKDQGTEVTRATIYAQDKLEKLLSLNINANPPDPNSCNQTASAQPASCNTTGNTASGWTQGLLAGGATAPIQTTCPSTGASVGYMDFLDFNGIQITGASCSAISGTSTAYARQWQIADITPNGAPATGAPAVKTITVVVYAQAAVNTGSGKPIVVLTTVLSNPN
jgi:hypothetical protein